MQEAGPPGLPVHGKAAGEERSTQDTQFAVEAEELKASLGYLV